MPSNLAEAWRKLITEYIDDLNEQNNIAKMKGAIIAVAFIEHLLTAKTSDDKQNKGLQKELAKLQKITANERNLSKIEGIYQKFVKEEWVSSFEETIANLKSMTDYHKIWIRYALLQINYVTPATHVAKLTHSSSGGSSLIDDISEVKAEYLTTSTLTNLIYDGAYPNASLSKVAKFLLLSLDGTPLGKLLKAGNSTPLQNILTDDELNSLLVEFQTKLNPRPKADSLAKQVYYPVDDDYHLLVVLKPSSLIQAIYDTYFGKEIRKQRDKIYKQKEKGKYSDEVLQSLPNVVTLSTVMSQPQNVSVNNGSRGGNIRLFNGAPPIWQSQLNPPIRLKSMFNARFLNHYAYDNIIQLRKLLLTFENANISFKDPNRLKGVSNWVKAIAHNIIDYSQTIAILPAGWTNDSQCNLPIAHQIFLDFDRRDDEFVTLKRQSDWQGQLVKDFVKWLNKSLKGKDNEFIASGEHSRIWRDIFTKILREHMEIMSINDTALQNNQNRNEGRATL